MDRDEYTMALREYRAASESWHANDEPQDGPVLDRLLAATGNLHRLSRNRGR